MNNWIGNFQEFRQAGKDCWPPITFQEFCSVSCMGRKSSPLNNKEFSLIERFLVSKDSDNVGPQNFLQPDHSKL